MGLLLVSEVVAPNAALVAYTVLVMAGLIGSIVTALKGRWLWFLVGLFLTAGLLCLYSAFLPAEPGSVWARWEARRTRRQAG